MSPIALHPNAPTPRHARAGFATALAVVVSASAWSGAARAERVAGIGASSSQAAQALHARLLQRLEGGTLTLTELRGQVVVLNFWATWCAPCRRELPRLERLEADIAKQGGRVLAVSVDQDRRNVELFVQRNRVKLPVVLDGAEGLARQLDLRAVPVTLVLDRAGQVAYSTTRSDEVGLQALTTAVRQLLADRPVASIPAGGTR